MVHSQDGLLRTVSVFQHITVLLLLTHLCEGQSQEIGPPQAVMVMVGDDVVLPCQLEPPMDAVSMTVEWARLNLNPRFVHVWHDGQELLSDQNKAYKGRVSLSVNKLKHGDISLNLSKVRISDNGKYRCYIPKLSKEYFVELLVGAVSSPVTSLAGIDRDKGGVVLQCESAGWHPEPEVLWLDGEGKLLSAGPTETVRGPDDLYTVSSRVTVEKRHSNSFTCRVQQRNINQTTETHIQVPEDFFMAQTSCTASTVTSVLFGLMFVLTVVLFVWKWIQNKKGSKTQLERKTEERDGEENAGQQLLMERQSKEQLKTENKKMKEELQKKEEELKTMTQVTDSLSELKNELEKQKGKLTDQMEKAARRAKENEEKVHSVEKEVTEKEGDRTANKAQGYSKLKEIITENSWSLEERKKELQQLHMHTDKLMKRTIDHYVRITGKKMEDREDTVYNNTEQIKRIT
ncbi:butyrophilin subfamily 2 member A2-like [Epinephelus fuscoguttatus]|uniref:butyrophilin subfamily 2 member A2-like n=1 Tax=Epinephelus fuscoguttatus TaxID=293821 RepID=UPI0020CFFD4A|nr:butyrophilin subfamily 2 member A2-like [Epinephelus fuscoguttatus]